MAETISRALRDGALAGELAPALTIKDTITSPFGHDVFNHLLVQLSSNILAGKSQAKGIVVVAFSRSPVFYFDLLRARGIDVDSCHKWIRILDCYSDPLGWNNKFCGTKNSYYPAKEPTTKIRVCCNVEDLEKLFSFIIEQGGEMVGKEKIHFSVAIDSVAELLRHVPISRVSMLISTLRSFDQISSVFWLLHSDLHEIMITDRLEYMSSMVASLEPANQLKNGQRGEMNLPLLEQNSKSGKFNARLKRRNGRVRLLCEDFHMEQSGIKFTSSSSSDGVVNQDLLPKLQFNLQLTEKERMDRAQVVLPFEHQGIGKPIQIYDGRAESKDETIHSSTGNLQSNEDSGKGEIIYFRDSDDERPDSDEDPDDDLDI